MDQYLSRVRGPGKSVVSHAVLVVDAQVLSCRPVSLPSRETGQVQSDELADWSGLSDSGDKQVSIIRRLRISKPDGPQRLFLHVGDSSLQSTDVFLVNVWYDSVLHKNVCMIYFL